MINLTDWTYLFTHNHLDIYGYGILRVAIDEYGGKVISYLI